MTNLEHYFPDFPRRGEAADTLEIKRISKDINPAFNLARCQPDQVRAAWLAWSEQQGATRMVVMKSTVEEFMDWLRLPV